MGARTKDSVIDHAMELIFNQGFTLTKASSEVGVDHNIISKRIRARGFSIPKPKAKPIKKLPDKEIIALYKGGMSELALANKFNVSRGAIRNRLRDSGTHIRGQSEACALSLGQMTFKERQNRTRSANNALRGTEQCVEGRRKRAVNLESVGYEKMIGIGEKEFKDMLESNSIDFTWQKSCDIYSIDFAIGNIAVELKKSSIVTNVTGDKKRGRIKNLRESGYTTIYVVFCSVESLIQSFDYIISIVNKASSNPPALGEYWVVRCHFNEVTRFRNDLGQFASVPSAPELFNTVSIRKY